MISATAQPPEASDAETPRRASMSSSSIRASLVAFRGRHGVPAIGAGIVEREGAFEPVVVGDRIRGGSERVLPTDRWHLGSCGKSITASLYGRLVETGTATWDATLGELFPDLAGGIHREWAEVPLLEAFVHRSGLRANLTRAGMRASWADPRPLPEQRTELAAIVLAVAPGKRGRFVYSNLGYTLIGAAIERLTGSSYEVALAKHLFEPLGITSGGFGPPPDLWGHEGRMIALGPLGAIDLGRTKPGDPARPESDNPAVITPAGRMHMSIADWARFQRIFLTRGGGYLRPETVERILTPIPGPGMFHAFGWAPIPPTEPEGSLGQQGSNMLWHAVAIIDRRRERTAIAVTNEGTVKMMAKMPRLAMELLVGA